MKKTPLIAMFLFLSLFSAILVVIVGLVSHLMGGFLQSRTLYQISNQVDSQFYLKMLDEEIPTLIIEQQEKGETKSLLESFLSINLRDPLSLLSWEIPGLREYKGQVLVQTDTDDLTPIPHEQEPSPEAWAQIETDSIIPDEVPVMANLAQVDKPVVFVYQTHNRESWMSEVEGAKSFNDAVHPTQNITLVGKRFSEKLKEIDIPVLLDQTDFTGNLKKENKPYSLSYALSSETVTAAMARNSRINYIFDFHRDALARDKTTATINGKEYARIMFVIGKYNKNWDENLAFANKLQEIIEKKYPGLARPIVGYEKTSGQNGEYNQSISSNALTVEIGGVENTLEESYRTVEILAEAFAALYLDAVPVFQEEGKKAQ